MKLKHRTGGRTIDVAPDMVAMYESEGWVRVPATAAKKATAKRRQAAKPTDTSTPTTS